MRTLISNKGRLIRNGGSALNRSARRICLYALEEALSAVSPYQCVRSRITVQNKQLQIDGLSIPLARFRRIMLLAVGKASASMMRASLDALSGFPVFGILVAPKGERMGTLNDRVKIFSAAHPLPDRDGLEASRSVTETISGLQEDELLICLISGGASAMLPAPAPGFSLQEKRRVTELLVKSKATIHEINAVRRHLSSLKGGRLVELCRASTVLSLIISDVPGNYLPDIASGLTVEDPTTYQDALGILKSHGLWDAIPERIRKYLTLGVRGAILETPKPGNRAFQRVHNIIVADNRTACLAAKRALKANRIQASILTSSAEMEATHMGRLLASIAVESKEYGRPLPRAGAIIIGGETTVQVKGNGVGGRNQETTLAAVDTIAGLDGTVVAALGTDGIDGNSLAAGAMADGRTSQRAKKSAMTPTEFLARNDSYNFFRKLKDSLVTGRTGTNVGDIYMMVSSG